VADLGQLPPAGRSRSRYAPVIPATRHLHLAGGETEAPVRPQRQGVRSKASSFCSNVGLSDITIGTSADVTSQGLVTSRI
jgi:hypothetical protein